MRKRFSTLLETYRSASNTSTKNYYDNVLNSNYYSQLNHQALMFAYERSLYDKYSGGEHITALGYDDDAGDVLIDLVCKNMEILHSFEVEKKKKKIIKNKSNCALETIKVPVTSYKYAMARNRNGFLKGRNGFIEYDMVNAQEYRVYVV